MRKLIKLQDDTIEVNFTGENEESFHDYILHICRQRLLEVSGNVKTFAEESWGRKKALATMLDVDAAMITRFGSHGFSCSVDLLPKLCMTVMGYPSVHEFLFGITQPVPTPPILEWIRGTAAYLTQEEFNAWMREMAIYDEKQFRRHLLSPGKLAAVRIKERISWMGGTPICLPFENTDAFLKVWIKTAMKNEDAQGRMSSVMMMCWYMDMPADYWVVQDYSRCGLVSLCDGKETAWSAHECKFASSYLRLNEEHANRALASLMRYACAHWIADMPPGASVEEKMQCREG